MKPLSEFLEEFPHENWWGEHDPKRCRRCKLQAWLREADVDEPPKWFDKALEELFPDAEYLFTMGNALWRRVRLNLLGTTRLEGEK